MEEDLQQEIQRLENLSKADLNPIEKLILFYEMEELDLEEEYHYLG